MKFYDSMIKYLHKFYSKDEFIKAFIKAAETLFDKAETIITRLLNLMHFNRLDEKGCIFWEKLLKIKDIAENIEERQTNIRARWRAKGHNSIALIQNIMDAWRPRASVVDFLDGIILIKIRAEEFIYKTLKSVFKTIDDTKVAHLGLKIDVTQENKVNAGFYAHTKIFSTVYISSED